MTLAHEAQDSLRERARRALLDNPEVEADPLAGLSPRWEPPGREERPAEQPDAPDEPADATSGASQSALIDLRLRAIRLVRELEPRRACVAERVRDLSRTLVETPGDSIHYATMLDKLREAHREWLALEEKVWAAHYIIRSTQWLVELLADPGSAPPLRGGDVHAKL
jgi:hypothetical protein